MRELEVTSDETVPANQAAEEDLARRAAARDEDAWSQLFDAHYRGVFAFVRSRTGSLEAAEDMAAQVFEIAFSRASSFDYRGVPMEAWLIGIARNLVRDHFKKLVRRGPETALAEAAEPAAPDGTDAVDFRGDLAKAMSELTEDQQTVIALRFLLDRPVHETALLMERSDDAVKTLQRRALAALQRALAGTG